MKSFRDVYGREWFLADEFDLSEDLSQVSAYLRQQGVVHRIAEEEGRQRLWVEQQELIEHIGEFIRQWRAGDVVIEKTPTSSLHQPAGFARLTSIFEQFPVTWGLLIASFFGYFAVQLAGDFPFYEWMTFAEFDWYRLSPTIEFSLPFSQPWRFWTPMFLHYGLYHIAGNAVFLWYLGTRIEKVDGSLNYLLFVLIVGAGANIGQFAWEHNPQFGGMSGVNYGFVGYVLIRQMLAPHPLLKVPKGLLIFSIVAMLVSILGVIDLFIDGGIANAAHVTGFMIGITWGFYVGHNLSHKNRQSRL